MASIEDPSVSEWFSTTMEDIRNKLLVPACGEMTDMGIGLYQTHKHFITSAVDTCSKKCNDDEMLFETIQTFKKDLEQKKTLVEEKKKDISERMSEIEQKEVLKDDLIQQIETLREEQVKRRELIVSQHKANKDRLRNLQKSRQVFQDRLGLEISKIRGEKVHFVFRNINPANPDSESSFTLVLEDNVCQIVSSDPVIECMPDLEKRLQETNNLSAFLANVRKEFASQGRF